MVSNIEKTPTTPRPPAVLHATAAAGAGSVSAAVFWAATGAGAASSSAPSAHSSARLRFQKEAGRILVGMQRSLYLRATSWTSSKSASSRSVGSKPRLRNLRFDTSSSFSAASWRGLGRNRAGTPVCVEIMLAMSRTRRVSATWLKISTGAPTAGGLAMASSTHLHVSAMWMKARVWPPVPYTVSGTPRAACMRNRLSTVP
mmetsp:Transcript_1555/g.5998  ORF Transcript_1555/g.5998 Transcript_1555/m.5998 type:complete len:201 (-) Transcript_1555:868-1470(-)